MELFSTKKYLYSFYFFSNKKSCGTHLKGAEGLLLSTHNISLVKKLENSLPGPKVIELFSCSTHLSMKFVLLIDLKLLTTANSFWLNIAEHEIFSANKCENANNSWHFHIY